LTRIKVLLGKNDFSFISWDLDLYQWMRLPSMVLSQMCFSDSLSKSFNHQIPLSQINATWDYLYWSPVGQCTTFLISCDFELDLTMNGDFRPWFCPWMFSASQQAFNHQIPLTNKRLLETTLTRIKPCLARVHFFSLFPCFELDLT
jgi:hypothetical protein